MIADLDDAADTRWPRYRHYAVTAGMRGMRAFPVTSLGMPLGSVIVHTDEPWGQSRPNDFGQILANLTSIALSTSGVDNRHTHTAETVEAVLEGAILFSTAIGVIAEARQLSVAEARVRLFQLARGRGVSVTVHARAIVDAQNAHPSNPVAAGVFDPGREPE